MAGVAATARLASSTSRAASRARRRRACSAAASASAVGHAGTLDPDATGVLLVGVGNVTRLLRFLTALGKRYTAEVVLGVETSTLDSSGEVLATHDMSGATVDQVRTVVAEHKTRASKTGGGWGHWQKHQGNGGGTDGEG
jgi:tRNA pseudouridine(55) synthase